MLLKKIFKLMLKEIKESIDMVFCHNYVPTSIYIKYFKLRTQLKIKKDLSPCLKGQLIEINEIIENENIKWNFPSDLRYRGLIRYVNSINWQGRMIGKTYGIEKLNFESGDIVIDCGANFGDILLFFYNLNLKNLFYYGFEPGKLEFDALNLNIKNPKITGFVTNKALGDKDGFQKFYYSPEDADSSLEKPRNYSSSFIVETITLDNFISRENLTDKRIKLFKLEAEGFEPEVLNGAKNSLKNIEYISADLGPERGVAQDCTVAEVNEILERAGFSMQYFNNCYRAIYKNKNLKI